MAITVIAQPQLDSLAFNPNVWYFDSTNKAESGFRYICTVKVVATGEELGVYSLRPIPTTLYGEVDVSKLIQTKLEVDFQEVPKYYLASKQVVSYAIDVDEEYFITHAFTGFAFAGASNWVNHNDPSVNPNGFDRTRLTHSTEPPYIAGDIINIKQNAGVGFRAELEGIHTVLEVVSISGVWSTVLALNWIGGASSTSGNTEYADGKKTVVTGITTSTKNAYKSALPFSLYKTYDRTQWQFTGLGKALTSLPEQVRISKVKPSYFFGRLDDVAPYVYFNIGGIEYRTEVVGNPTMFNILPATNNIDEVFSGGSWIPFVGTIDLTNVSSYQWAIYSLDGVDFLPASKVYTIQLYNECDFHDTIDITFQDRMGSLITIPFYKAIYINQSIDRQSFRRKYGGLNGSTWTYNLKDAGEQIFDISEDITYTANTGQLNEVESYYFRELVSTPQAFASINGGDMQAIVIQTSSLNLPKARTTKERNLSIDFKFAVQDEING